MQNHTVNYQPVTLSMLSLPSNCSGIADMPVNDAEARRLIFWFPNDDLIQADSDAINATLAAYKFGEAVIVPSGEADTYTVTIITTEDDVTPTINGLATELLVAVDGTVIFEVVATETFVVGTLLLDMEEVTYVID